MPLRGKQRSNLQKSASLKGLGVIYHNKENIDLPASSQSLPSTSGSSVLGRFASGFETRIAELKRKLHNERRKLSRAENSKAALRTKAVNAETELVDAQADLARVTAQNEGLQRKAHASFMRGYRAPGRLRRDAEKSQTRFLKEKGVITDSSREMTRELVAECSVPVTRVNKVIRTVARGFGITVKDTVDKHSVSRILLEGELASEIQLVSEMHNAGNLTISGDGTTNKHINLESKHGLMVTPTYASDPDAPAMNTIPSQRFFGINTAIDHKSETQLQGWKDLIDRMYKVYNDSPLGHRKPLNPLEFARLVTGMNTDHAEDQKKLVRLFKSWKDSCEREMRGEEAILLASLSDLIPLIWEETERNISDAGGLTGWQALSADERTFCEREAYRRMCVRLGEDILDSLTPEQRQYAALFIWGGCCMHKEMNSVKGGNARMMAFWDDAGIVGPMKLFNRDNAAAAALGGSAARQRAGDNSQAGGVKLTSLAGAVFANKDKKKGQQDSLQVYLQSVIGYMVCFPNTSSTRYQSHCCAAAELLVRREFYRQFLELVRDLKEKRSFTNIEQNIYLALDDDPTITELCVLTLYAQAVSHPYMRLVRGPEAAETNLLDLGPVHDKVKAHCRAVIANPDLLISATTSYETGSMDGKIWERPDAVYAVLGYAPHLPHLRGALVAFFEGALDTWERFTDEYRPEGAIASASISERRCAYMKTTNNDNEGALGEARRASQHTPNMTLNQHNVHTMYRKNNTVAFIRTCLGPEDLKYLRWRARELDASGVAKDQREQQATAYKETVDKKRKAASARKAVVDAKRTRIDAVVPRLDTQSITDNPGTNNELDLQLEWHRRLDSDKHIPPKTKMTRKEDKVTALVAAVKRYNEGTVHAPEATEDVEMLAEVPDDLDEEESDWEH